MAATSARTPSSPEVTGRGGRLPGVEVISGQQIPAFLLRQPRRRLPWGVATATFDAASVPGSGLRLAAGRFTRTRHAGAPAAPAGWTAATRWTGAPATK